MAMRRTEDSNEQLQPFTPSFPFFIVFSDGSPIIGNDGPTSFVMACSTLELGELVIAQFREDDSEPLLGLSQVGDHDVLADVARQLVNQGVTHMSWNATRRSTTINVIELADFIRPTDDDI